MRQINSAKLSDLYWLLEFGFPKKKGTIYDLRLNDFSNIIPPVFFLSTGRCGTMWFSKLLQKCPHTKVLHDPVPSMAAQNKFAYAIQSTANSEELVFDSLKEIYLTGREQYLRYAYKTEKRIIETNNHITFFAPMLADLFPEAKFVHLYRHPGEFSRSGMRRNWYKNNNKINQKLIEPLNTNSSQAEWEKWGEFEKILWLWNETNQFIEAFKKNIEDERLCSFNFNEISVDRVKDLLAFIDLDLNDRVIAKLIKKKVNVQSVGEFETYDKWTEEQRQIFNYICGSLAQQYGFTLKI